MNSPVGLNVNARGDNFLNGVGIILLAFLGVVVFRPDILGRWAGGLIPGVAGGFVSGTIDSVQQASDQIGTVISPAVEQFKAQGSWNFQKCGHLDVVQSRPAGVNVGRPGRWVWNGLRYNGQVHSLVGSAPHLGVLLMAANVAGLQVLHNQGMCRAIDKGGVDLPGCHGRGEAIDLPDKDEGAAIIHALGKLGFEFKFIHRQDGIWYGVEQLGSGGYRVKRIGTKVVPGHKNNHYHISLPRLASSEWVHIPVSANPFA